MGTWYVAVCQNPTPYPYPWIPVTQSPQVFLYLCLTLMMKCDSSLHRRWCQCIMVRWLTVIKVTMMVLKCSNRNPSVIVHEINAHQVACFLIIIILYRIFLRPSPTYLFTLVFGNSRGLHTSTLREMVQSLYSDYGWSSASLQRLGGTWSCRTQ